jgi:hypothetical protein
MASRYDTGAPPSRAGTMGELMSQHNFVLADWSVTTLNAVHLMNTFETSIFCREGQGLEA